MIPNEGDAPIFREIAAMATADRRHIARWSAAMRGNARMLCWQSTDLHNRAAAARATALALCERLLKLQATTRLAAHHQRSQRLND